MIKKIIYYIFEFWSFSPWAQKFDGCFFERKT